MTTKTDGSTTTANNVGDALTNLNNEVVKPITFAGNSGTVDRKLGETLNITGGLTGAGSNSNIKTVITKQHGGYPIGGCTSICRQSDCQWLRCERQQS
ncbi:hypothetical protein PY247_21440 [Acinetobacter proteolyticus]|nr:hypothetical protein [Acinetobacter proteolyticus]WEI18633.1 hypothetical protein PY247_21440 [Acinetobacter proteolyticus]